MSCYAVDLTKVKPKPPTDPWGNPYKAQKINDKPSLAKTVNRGSESNSRQRKRSRNSGRPDQLNMTVSQLALHRKMVEKNFNIRQRDVNEDKPFISY